MNNRVRVGIAGFQGYSGAELVKILEAHPRTFPVLLEHRSDDGARALPIDQSELPRIPCSAESVGNEQLAAVFLATPPQVSMELAPGLLKTGATVIDLSGAFRLGDEQTYARWYGEPHAAPELFQQAVYGLPEVFRGQIAKASLISNPGCYPTAANLAIQPLVDAGVLDLRWGVICDAKSGVSGAGRKPSLKTSFCEVTENLSVYSVFDHRHVPEVLAVSGLNEDQFTFTAQLLPVHRGILETIYVRTRGVENAAALLDIYRRRYQGERFVRLYQPGQLPDLKSVQHTNFCDIGFHFDQGSGRAVIVSAIDNLGKGAAGQAVQNLNLALQFRETDGLL